MKRSELEPPPLFITPPSLNTLAFYSALDAFLLYVNKIQEFFVHFSSNFAELIPMKIRIKLCLADSGQPFCLVVWALKLPQFEVSTLSGVSRHLPPLHHQTLIEHWWGWWGPPFSWLLCPTISSFILYLRFKFCIIFMPSGRWQLT